MRVAQKLSQLSGVGLVSLTGGMRPAVRIAGQPARAGGLRASRSTTSGPTITNQNTDTPKGSFDGPAQNSTINDNDQLQSAQEYGT